MFPDKSVVLDVHTRSVKGSADVNSDFLTGVDGDPYSATGQGTAG